MNRKILKCYNCSWDWKPLVDNPKACPECGRDYRKPSLAKRLRIAAIAFRMKPKGGVKPRAKVSTITPPGL